MIQQKNPETGVQSKELAGNKQDETEQATITTTMTAQALKETSKLIYTRTSEQGGSNTGDRHEANEGGRETAGKQRGRQAETTGGNRENT